MISRSFQATLALHNLKTDSPSTRKLKPSDLVPTHIHLHFRMKMIAGHGVDETSFNLIPYPQAIAVNNPASTVHHSSSQPAKAVMEACHL
ncbi:MAG: hypothetical protein V1706_02435 [Pseudomonadota bacterium]